MGLRLEIGENFLFDAVGIWQKEVFYFIFPLKVYKILMVTYFY